MKILIFHPTILPPSDYGGVERVVLWLARGLYEEGHQVWVAALKGSKLPQGIQLLEVDPDRRSATDLLNSLPKGMDLVHFMAPPEDGVWDRLPCAAVLTVHGNGKPGERFPRNTVFLSQDHAKRHSAEAYVYNGIDPDEYLFKPDQKNNRFLFLSKTSWRVKNLEGAIQLCHAAGVPLDIAGGSRPFLLRLKALFHPDLRWIGPVGGAIKAQLLARAKALVFPVNWPEPFGLVVVEALVSGTPVLASRRGSMPELIPPDVGAVLDPGDPKWIDLLKVERLPFDPFKCREWVLERFHYRGMAQAYLQVYGRVLDGDMLNPSHPVAQDWRTQ